MRFRNRHPKHTPKHTPTHLFPSYLETAEETVARLGRDQAAYVAQHATRR